MNYLSHLVATTSDAILGTQAKVEGFLETIEIETCQQSKVVALLDIVIGAYYFYHIYFPSHSKDLAKCCFLSNTCLCSTQASTKGYEHLKVALP